MSTIKTFANDGNVGDFIDSVNNDSKRTDAYTLLKIHSDETGEQPKMWGSSIIGFGQYHYKSEKSSQEGDWPLAGFSPRKQSLTIYVTLGFGGCEDLLQKLGKHKTSKSCLYINKLVDVDQGILRLIIKQSYEHSKRLLVEAS